MAAESSSSTSNDAMIALLEQRLQDATADRDQTQVKIQKAQKDLDETVRKAVKRPDMDTVENVDQQIQ
jgi:hypothetical protein